MAHAPIRAVSKLKSVSHADELSALLDLYRAAQRQQAEGFAAHTFEWLRARVPFDVGVIVTTFEKQAAWVDAHFFGIDDPRALMASHAQVRHLDILTPRMLATPMQAQRQDGDDPEVAGPRFAPLRDHLRKFGAWFSICIVVPSAEHHTSSVMMVGRREHSSRFSDADVELVQAVAPHLAEAAAVNRTVWLPRSAGPDTGALPAALLDTGGRFVQTNGAFVLLFWPHAPPATAYLSDDALKALQRRQPWPLPGGKHTLYGEPEDTGGWRLRIRSTSAVDQLSARERQVATLFARGASYKAIAKKLGLAPTTARNHLQNIYGKLGVTQRNELIELVAKP